MFDESEDYLYYSDDSYTPWDGTFGDTASMISTQHDAGVIGANLDDGSSMTQIAGIDDFRFDDQFYYEPHATGGSSLGGFFDSISNALGNAFGDVADNVINSGTSAANQQISQWQNRANNAINRNPTGTNTTAATGGSNNTLLIAGGVLLFGFVTYLVIRKS